MPGLHIYPKLPERGGGCGTRHIGTPPPSLSGRGRFRLRNLARKHPSDRGCSEVHYGLGYVNTELL
jgi:hypothetical protein